MVDGISEVTEFAPPPAEGGPDVSGFLAKAAGGTGIEELILQDTHAQRKAATARQKAQREQRRKLVERAVKKMKDAAGDRFWSNLGEAASGLAGSVIGAIPGSKWNKVIGEGVDLLGGSLFTNLLLGLEAIKKDGAARLLQEAAQGKGDAARDTGEWLASARELERRMVDRLDQLTRSEHENRMSVMNRIGG